MPAAAALIAMPLSAAEPSSARIGDYNFPVDESGAVILDEHRIAPNHVTPIPRDPKDGGVCVRVCSSYGIGDPIPGDAAWRRYCLET